ncbi:hypothetical protein NDU88_008032 [Pleurodeles waltl]|uniref:Uncharacterized protein n=1 Tax=Pleurodeles waltl TaxID=8319 RepID=A0AAV7VVB2_PLEWA|nr:hypothetical protein NDU88_008032 [Pleurodeles waltl]
MREQVVKTRKAGSIVPRGSEKATRAGRWSDGATHMNETTSANYVVNHKFGVAVDEFINLICDWCVVLKLSQLIFDEAAHITMSTFVGSMWCGW